MFQTYEELHDHVLNEGGAATISMAEFVSLEGAGGLGRKIVGRVADRLSAQGLGHYPTELPSRSDQEIRVWVVGSPVGKLLGQAYTTDRDATRYLNDMAEANSKHGTTPLTPEDRQRVAEALSGVGDVANALDESRKLNRRVEELLELLR